MADGSPPPGSVGIERSCGGRIPVRLTQTNKKGEFRWIEITISVTVDQCVWRAVLNGYQSTELDIDDIQRSNNLPDIVLRPMGEIVPAAAGARWNLAAQSMNAGDWAAAERYLAAISADFPQSAPIWTQLGVALARQQKTDDALRAFDLAIQKAPRYLPAYESLAWAEMQADRWKEAEAAAAAGTKADPKGTLPALYLDLAEIREHLSVEGAEEAARKAIAFDKKRELPRAEYVLGSILADAEDNAPALEHLQKYLDLAPNGPDAAAARARIRTLGTSAAGGAALGASAAAEARPLDQSLDRSLEGATEVGVPGGLKALAIAARLKRTPSPADFFLEYCRAIASDADDHGRGDAEDFPDVVETYLATITELNRLAGAAGSITLTRDTQADSDRTARILELLGWRIGQTPAQESASRVAPGGQPAGAPKPPMPAPALGLLGREVARAPLSPRSSAEDVPRVEPGDQPADAPRQQIAAALGIDEIEMAKSLDSGGSYRFEIPRAQALLLNAPAWRALAGGLPPGGFAELFIRNPRLAGVYAGLAGMGPGAAAALVSGAGLRAVVNKYADLVRTFGESLSVSGGRASVPGGPEAEAVWQALAGASPRDPKAFFPALLEKDQGRLAAFYFALSRADAAHRRFFTLTAARSAQFYKWYRDSSEIRFKLNLGIPGWRRTLFQQLPLDSAGTVRFPGGRTAWTANAGANDDSLPGIASLEALVPVANVEAARDAPLDEASARLLAEHYRAWRPLFPYFEKLPGLGRPEFEALAAFEQSVSARAPEARNAVLGEWHSLAKLIELGSEAGSLDAAAGAHAFRAACEALSAPDFSARALAAFREMADGASDPDEFAAAGLLRLSGPRRASFERVKEIQRTPPLGSLAGSSDDRTLAGLTGLVYAALLDPDILLVSEDPMLAAKHTFSGDIAGPRAFLNTRLELSHEPPGAHFEGGFMTFEEEARLLARAKIQAAGTDAASAGMSSAAATEAGGPSFVPRESVFRASGRLVEIYATVTDDRGGYVDDLERADFTLLDDGDPAPIGTFENHSSGVSVALVLDTTGSMTASLPSLRSSALRLIADLRPVDSVAVYSFNRTLSELQPFTRNKDLAKRAVLHTRASGSTGLYDALASVTREISGRPGKKVIVVFTDGADNASALTADAAIRRAKTEGVAVYTIAQGEALTKSDLMAQLATVAEATGGLAFTIKYPSEIRGVFDHISQDLLHGYLLVFQPPAGPNHEWHSLVMTLRGPKPRKVRAREGYYSD